MQFEAPRSLTLKPGDKIQLKVVIKNISTKTWGPTKESGITLGNHWLNQYGELIRWSDGRVELPRGVAPGEQVVVTLQVQAPVEKDRYLLELDLVEEGITWFKDKDAKTTFIDVSVM